MIDWEAFEQTRVNARVSLLEQRNAQGHWEGELSSSALSTATAVFALALFRKEQHPSHNDAQIDTLIARGFEWLTIHQNSDGGWGDTVKSFSNISTTALCWAAFSVGQRGMSAQQADKNVCPTIQAAEKWLARAAGGIHPDHLIPAIIRRYGKDHTFSVPILTMCALAERLGDGREAWKRIPQLPFELAAFPQRWFKWLRLPVVSYALPALIAIGLVRHERRPSQNPIGRMVRHLARDRAMRLLQRIQPQSGGFLEATPLTSFVAMSLIGAGLSAHPVVQRGIDFLIRSARPDGSWPIDTNLATWVTTLATNALAIDPQFTSILPDDDRAKIRDWLLDQQYRVEHPYTLADPGGWAWTNLSGGVPDADDTPGAILALKNLQLEDARTRVAAAAGLKWLAGLQNRDGGIPTFCRGWGKLPFDRSSADLTAHYLRARAAWCGTCDRQAIEYLLRARSEGHWSPLWFGNQHPGSEENPVYGTSRVLCAAAEIKEGGVEWDKAVREAIQWLCETQNPDGGWGGGRGAPSSIEETALAVEALAKLDPADEWISNAIDRGVQFLIDRTHRGTTFEPSPIGFYFAKLWYFERLYPLIFTVAAFNAIEKTRMHADASSSQNSQGVAGNQ